MPRRTDLNTSSALINTLGWNRRTFHQDYSVIRDAVGEIGRVLVVVVVGRG